MIKLVSIVQCTKVLLIYIGRRCRGLEKLFTKGKVESKKT